MPQGGGPTGADFSAISTSPAVRQTKPRKDVCTHDVAKIIGENIERPPQGRMDCDMTAQGCPHRPQTGDTNSRG